MGRALTLDSPQPDRGLKSVGRYVRQRVQVSTHPFTTPTFYEKNLLVVLPWFEWIVLGTNSPCRIWGSGLRLYCSPLDLQPSSLFGICPDLGLFCGLLLSSNTVLGLLHCQPQILLFFFCCQAFKCWPLLGLLPGRVNSLLAKSFHQKTVSSTFSIVEYFPHNCSSTGCRDFSVSLVPVYVASHLKESLELRAPKRPVACWLWKQVGVQAGFQIDFQHPKASQ